MSDYAAGLLMWRAAAALPAAASSDAADAADDADAADARAPMDVSSISRLGWRWDERRQCWIRHLG